MCSLGSRESSMSLYKEMPTLVLGTRGMNLSKQIRVWQPITNAFRVKKNKIENNEHFVFYIGCRKYKRLFL